MRLRSGKEMVFIRYQHVERIDADEVRGLLDGVCHVFPKMDGSNMCAYTEDGEVRTMSRNREIRSPEPFAVFVEGHENIGRFLRDFPGIRLYGEWMVPHTVRSYRPDVWNRWFVFDVTAEDVDAVYAWGDGNELRCAGRQYIPYEEYAPILDAYGIEYIPPLAVIENPDVSELGRIADEGNTWMVADGAGCGEGVVVKRYGFVNVYGRTAWAKVLNRSFSVFKVASRGSRCEEKRDGTTTEHEIALRYVTQDLVDKEYSRITAEGGQSGSVPGRLLSTVWHCVVTECMWDAVKRYKSPTVDFKLLRRECELRTKAIRPEVFGLRGLEVPDEIGIGA